MNQMIVYAGDHSNAKLMAFLLIGSALVIVGILVMYLFRNSKKKKS